MKTSDLIKILEKAGWTEIRQRSRHRIFNHAILPNLIAVPDLGEKSLKIGLLNDILKEAGFKGAVVRKIRFRLRWLDSLVNVFKKVQ